jgi:hypothetical protein
MSCPLRSFDSKQTFYVTPSYDENLSSVNTAHPAHNYRLQARQYNYQNNENNENIQTDRAHTLSKRFQL